MRSPFLIFPLLAAAIGIASAQTQSCGTSGVMCVSAVSQANSTTQYTLTVKQSQVGWMAIGFGSLMTNTPLVVMWRDSSTGKAVLSHRQTSTYVEPSVVSNPSRVATALQYKTSATSSQTSLSFEIPSASGSRTIVWAYSQTAPSDPSNSGSSFIQHDDMGTMQVTITSNGTTGSGNGTTGGGDSGNGTTGSGDTGDTGDSEDEVVPLTNAQRMLAAHGIIMTMAFLIILPLGAIFVRLTRTWIPGRIWFATHWVFQWPLAGALIAVGFGLGVYVVQQAGKPHFSSDHKKFGLALVILYVIQCTLGGIIHFIKEKNRIRRPPQNYLHACLGLTIIGGSFWQVHNGYTFEWPKTQSRTVPTSINTLFIVWVVLIPLFYVGGLAFLPRQYKQERYARVERVTELTKRPSSSA